MVTVKKTNKINVKKITFKKEMANKEKVPRYWNNKKVQYFSNIKAQLDAAQQAILIHQ